MGNNQLPENTKILERDDLPAIYRAADQTSVAGQSRLNAELIIGLFMLIVAAVAGLFTLKVSFGDTMADVAGLVAAAAFFLSFIVQLDRLVFKPDQKWYDGRAVAESAKTLAWRYAVGGNPFRVDSTSQKDADAILIDRFRNILDQMQQNETPITVPDSGDQITARMRELRAQGLPERRNFYKYGRIQNQWEWYKQRSRWNQRRANFWNGILIAIEVLGFFAALLKGLTIFHSDLLGVAGTIAAAIISWVQMRQHDSLARSYSIAAMELSTIQGNIDDQTAEEDWATFVDEAEGAISREHTLWIASHTTAVKQLFTM